MSATGALVRSGAAGRVPEDRLLGGVRPGWLRMSHALAGAAVLLVGVAPAASAGTLGDLLRASGVTPPAHLPDVDRTLGASVVLQEGGETTVVYAAPGAGGAPELVALRLGPRRDATRRVPLAWPRAAPAGLDAATCQRLDSIRRHAGAVLVAAHVNPSASCTLVLGRDLALRAVLGGWPVATLPDGRIVYHRNEVHFTSSHPLALRLFDPVRRGDALLHPARPYQAIRRAHVARLRQVYTDAWCAPRNHPCDPEQVDERLASDVLIDAGGTALAFVVAFDNTTGWTDAERWGRLEPFRELRTALEGWDAEGPPPSAALARGLAAGLGRARNLGATPHVAAALADDPEVRDLVLGLLEGPGPQGTDAASWLAARDERWRDAGIWRRLARLVPVPDERTEVVYVYAGLRAGGRLRYREVERRVFEARFGPGAPAAALSPAVLTELFATAPR